MQRISIGIEATAVNSLIYVADEMDFFSANGIEAIIHDEYPSGAAAVEGMLNGDADISTAAEFAVVRHAFARKEICALGSIDMFTHMKLIARKDRGVEKISDLAGKTVGVPLKTAAEFNLGRFLDLNGIDKSRIVLKDIQAPEAVNAVVQGKIDAVVTWGTNVVAIRDRLGDKANVWDVQSGQPMYCLLIAADQWISDHPGLLENFMKSLATAEDFLIQHEDRARNIVQKRLGYTDEYVKTIWPEHSFTLALDHSLVLAMEDQARWMIENNPAPEKSVPDFLYYIREDFIKKVKPSAVSIIR